MMQRKLIKNFIFVLFIVFQIFSCSTTETQSDELAINGDNNTEEALLDDESDLDELSDEIPETGNDEGLDQEITDNNFDENLDSQNNEINSDGADELDPFAEATADPVESTDKINQTNIVSPPVEITDIQFKSNQSGGTVVIQTSGVAQFKTRQNDRTNQYIVEIFNAKLPKRLKQPYILKEFEGEFAAVNSYQNPGATTARIVIQLKRAGQAIVQQEGQSILVLPPTMNNIAAAMDDAAEGEIVSSEDEAKLSDSSEESYDRAAAERDEKALGAKTLDEFLLGSNKFYGRKLSIQMKDSDVRDALSFIAEFSGINMIVSDDVNGNISLKLREVPWDQALITVMRAKRLGYIRQGNVIRISTLETLKQESESARAILQSQKSLSPIRVKVIPVSYAKVDDLAKQLGSFSTEGRGKVAFDSRTSSIILTDTDEVIERISRLVKNLDIPPMQVMIEGKIVEATEEFQQSVGVNWGFDGETINMSDNGGANSGPLNFKTNMNIQPVSKTALTGNPFALNLSVGRLSALGELSAVLSLAEVETMAKILSSPRIVALNNEVATITQESQILTKTSVQEQGVVKNTIERTPVILKLNVTPQITASGSVIMDVNVIRQFAGGVVDTETLARAVNTREAKTKVLVDNGQTAVIGGVYQSDVQDGESGVPWLKDIPVLGWLFKSKQNQAQKNELLIFLTPRIIKFGDIGQG